MNKQHPIPFDKVNITGGFWKDRIALNESVTLDSVRRRFEDTGRFSALSCEWKQGEPDRPHFFYDSDAAKWMEAAAYVLERKNDKRLESYVEDLIDRIERNMTPDGYFNVWYTVVEPGKRFTDRDHHELYCAGHLIEAAVAYECGDEELLAAANRIFKNMTEHRMYITGGIGSTRIGEAFTVDGDLPNETAYAETCAAISLAMFAQRMSLTVVDSRYADIVERVIYNGFLSGTSLDGKSFFYENPLSIDLLNRRIKYWRGNEVRLPITQRVEVFDCSCCPPNVTRFVESIGKYIYSYDSDTVYVHQFMESDTDVAINGGTAHISQSTDYPSDGSVTIRVSGAPAKLAVRIPSWCRDCSAGAERAENLGISGGYLFFDCEDGAKIELDFDMSPVIISADPSVHEDSGKVAVMRGPVVYCAEGVDNGDIFSLAVSPELNAEPVDLGFGIPALDVDGTRKLGAGALYAPADEIKYEPTRIRLIPYFAFANRGESDMRVWMNIK